MGVVPKAKAGVGSAVNDATRLLGATPTVTTEQPHEAHEAIPAAPAPAAAAAGG